MPLTDRIDVFTQVIYDLIITNKTPLGLADVWYGDEDKVPTTPCVAVSSGEKTRVLDGASRRTLVDLTCYLMVYFEKIQGTEQNRKEAETLAEDVEAVLHADSTLGGIVVHSYVSRSEPGYASRGRSPRALLSVTRLTFTGISKVSLPMI
jgi:hypothetical protein